MTIQPTKMVSNQLPLSNNTAIKLLCLTFLFHPIWWLLGVDQIVIACIIPFIFLSYLIQSKMDIKGFYLHIVIFFFIFLHFVSGINVFTEEAGHHYVPLYIYRTFLFLSGPICFLIVSNGAKNFDDVLMLTKAVVWTLFFSVIATVIAYILFINNLTQYKPLISYLLPESFKQYGILNSFFLKEIIRRTFVFDNIVYRTRGLFNFSNLFAFSINIAIILSIYLTSRLKSTMYFFISVCLACALILTTSRAGLLSLFFSIFFIFLIISKKRLLIVSFLILAIATMSLIHVSGYEYYFSPQNLADTAQDKISGLRADSTKGRKMIYDKTFEFIKEKPIVGWGTYRRYPGKPDWPYLGSHSTLFSIIFRIGFLGLIFFAIFFILLFKETWKLQRLRSSSEFGNIGAYLAGIVIMNMSHMLVLDFHDDLITLNITWAVWGLIPALSAQSNLGVSQ